MSYIIHIKNMVCNRCVKVVGQELADLGYRVLQVELGKAIIEDNPDYERIDTMLLQNGFERLQDPKSKLIEEVKKVVREHLYTPEQDGTRKNLSHLIRSAIPTDYSYLSSLFSSTEGITIERYYILQKIERVKELIKYDELTLSQIADRLGYSSVAHLSSQFKKTTGLKPSEFAAMVTATRKPIDVVGSP